MTDKNTQKELNKSFPLPRPSSKDIEETFKGLGKTIEDKKVSGEPEAQTGNEEDNSYLLCY